MSFIFRVVSLGVFSLALAILMYFMEALYYHSTTLNFYIVFPCVLNGNFKIIYFYLRINFEKLISFFLSKHNYTALTLIGLLILPQRIWAPQIVCEDENAELLRQATAIRRKRQNKKEM